MFSLLGHCYSQNKRRGPKNLTLIILGLDNAGKTTAVRDLKGESKEEIAPSIGFANVTIKVNRNLSITLYDVGGGPTIRDIWGSYYADVHGFIYVIDSADTTRCGEVKKNLSDVMLTSNMAGKPVLILANKQDCEGALDEHSLAHVLDLENLVSASGCPCRLELCSAIEGDGNEKSSSAIKAGFKWLVQSVLKEWDVISERVIADSQEQKRLEAEARAARAERVRKMKEEREKAAALKEQQEKTQQEIPLNESHSSIRMRDLADAMATVGADLNSGMRSNKSSGTEDPNDTTVSGNISFPQVPSEPPRALPPIAKSEDEAKKKKKRKKLKKNQLAPAEELEDVNGVGDAQTDEKPSVWNTPPGQRSLKSASPVDAKQVLDNDSAADSAIEQSSPE